MSKRTRLVWIVAAWLLPLVGLVLLSGLGASVPVAAQPYAGADGTLVGRRAFFGDDPIIAGPAISIVKTGSWVDGDADGYADPGEVINYTFEVANEGDVPLTNVTVVDTVGGVSITGGPTTLDVGETDSTTFSGSYAITQDDIDAGSFYNVATADSDESDPATGDETVNLPGNAALSLVKTGSWVDGDTDGYADPGEVINYTFEVCNAGNVTLSNVTVTDPLVTVSGDPITLGVGQCDSTTFTGSYAITQDDIDAGSVYNMATADSDESDPATGDETVNLPGNAAIGVAKSSTTTEITSAGQVVPYSFAVTNGGNVSLTGITVTDATCDEAPAYVSGDTDLDGALDPDETWIYTCDRTVTQEEMDTGGNLSNTVTASSNETGDGTDTLDIPITQSPVIRVAKSSTTTEIIASSEVVPYTFDITNEGNVSLTGITVTDALCDAPPAYDSGDTDLDDALDLDETWIYTCDRTVTQEEIDAGGDLSNTVTADSTQSGPDTDTLDIPIAEYTLAIFKSGLGTVLKNPSKLVYHYGDVVELTATADPGWTFSQWSGAVQSTDNPVSLTIVGDTNVVVTFSRDEYTLTTDVVGSGTVSKNPDQVVYYYGDEVQLTAAAALGWTFSQWTGDVEGSDNPVSLTMDFSKTVTATFTPNQYTVQVYSTNGGTVTSDPAGISCPGDCSELYDYGTVVTLTAVPAAGWGFREWSGDVASADNPLSLDVDGNKTVIAVFDPTDYQVSVSLAGEGSGSVTSDPAGISCPGDCSEPYTYGTVVTLSATPAAGSFFNGWSGACTGTGTCVVTVDAGKSVVATFTPFEYYLTTNKVGTGSVTKSPDQATYHYGQVVELTAAAAPCWTFTGWTGALVSSENPASLTIDGDMTVIANFAELRYSLTTNVVGNGRVQRDPDQLTYRCGEAVLLTAVADPGWTFSGWSGALSGSTNPALLTMDVDKTVTANFIPDDYTLTVHLDGNGGVTKNPDQTTYRFGDEVELTATAAVGWTFSQWTGDVQGSDNPISLIMDSSKTVTATFTENEYTLTIIKVGIGNVLRVPDKNTYSWDEEVELTAVGETNWLFDHWSGAVQGTDNPANLRMDGNKTVTVTFIEARTLTVLVAVGGTVDIDPPGSIFPAGEQVTLTAIPDPGWYFAGWTGALSGSENPTTVIMDANKTISAKFVSRIYLPLLAQNWPPLPGVPTLYAIDNPDGLRTYTISWSTAPYADSYVLEEATDPTLADAHQIYAGGSTSHTVGDQMTGRYYYRVKSRNAWGDSAWSTVGLADVRWEAEPNDQLDQSNGPIVSGLTYYGTFPETDPDEEQRKDYFCFELTAPHRVQIWLTHVPAGRNYDLVLRRGDTSAVAYSVQPENADEYIDIPSLAPGFYYIQVYRTSGAGSNEPYHLRVVYQ